MDMAKLGFAPKALADFEAAIRSLRHDSRHRSHWERQNDHPLLGADRLNQPERTL